MIAVQALFYCHHPQLDQEAEALYAKSKDYHCQLEQLHRESQSLWDRVADNLSEGLPEDMPADERNNMITVRNTDLIKMFEVFPALDTSIQTMVEQAGQQDGLIAEKMRVLKDSIDANDNQVNNLLQVMSKENKASFQRWKTNFGHVSCD